jgi:para-aminobenzoate synthetase
MKTLVIDNYDSFTHNLVHLIAQLNQDEPTVVYNDDTAWETLSSRHFDNIVISPGPGRPDRVRDFGVCKDVIETARVPILGVCLGHQGIAMAAGAALAKAPSLVHGRSSGIIHNDNALFAGIPSPFMAARYHSFIIQQPLPSCLESIAWTEDGLTMAVAHRERPQWGVQFHPESILTEHGRLLLRNFRDLTVALSKKRRPLSSKPGTKQNRPAIPVSSSRKAFWHELSTAIDAETAFCSLYANSPHAFWLDGELAGPKRSRWSYLGDASGPHAATLQYRRRGEALEISDAQGQRRECADIFEYLRKPPPSRPQTPPPCPFVGGKIGWFGYELGSHSHQNASTPDAFLMEVDRFIAIDYVAAKTYICTIDGVDQNERAEGWLAETLARIENLPVAPPVDTKPRRTISQAPLQFQLSRNKSNYLAHVQRCLDLIRQGETYQVCLTNELSCANELNPLDIYRTLRCVNPAPFAAFIKTPEASILSASPERFLSADVMGHIETKPIKGTIRRDADPLRDRDLVELLKISQKDRAENAMIVDLLRNDLSRSCEPGSVVTERLFEVETYETVHQLVSTIHGTLTPERTIVDLLREALPGGSMTGAPKRRTMEIIDELEHRPRGIYSGALGWIGNDGAADLSIVIRAIIATDGRLTIGVGGGIVAASTPIGEFDEMLLKAKASIQTIVIAAFGHFDERLYRLAL